MILDQVIYQRIKEKKRSLDKLRPLPKAVVNRLREQVIIEWTYNSNAIEGTSLSLRETELVIEYGLTIKGKPLKEHFEAINHKEAIVFLDNLVGKGTFKLDQLLIRQIHQLILKQIDNENAGEYREVEVKITGSRFVPPSPTVVPMKMGQFGKWLAERANQRYVIDYAALAHFKLVDIHPFVDGNGRTARLLMNLVLMNRGYPPTIILKTERQKYYQTLDLAHQGEVKPFVNFIGRNVDRSLTWYLEAVTPVRKKKKTEKWQLLSKLAPRTPYSQEYLSLLARRDRIEAVKKGRDWYSNLKAVERYSRGVSKQA